VIYQLTREKERAFGTLQARDKENENLRQLLRSVKDPATANFSVGTAVSKSPKSPPMNGSGRPSYGSAGANKTNKFLASSSKPQLVPQARGIARSQSRNSTGSAPPASLNTYEDENNTREIYGGRLSDVSDDYGHRKSHASRSQSYMKPTISNKMHHQPARQIDEGGVDDLAHALATPVVGGGYRKGTVNAMASSRAQEAMLRHQERMQKKREMAARKANAEPGFSF